MVLQGKHIVLGITGSIAAYKAATLIRCLQKSGAEVQVVMTPAAKEFITPLTLATLTKKPVVSEFFDRRDGTWHSHVDLGLWADLMLVAPATAATLSKMAYGIADNMLITTYLSMKAPTWVAPAMDLDMYAHPSTSASLAKLQSYGVRIIEADEGYLASGLEGKGRMQAPEAIAKEVEKYFSSPTDYPLKGKNVLITAGPTHEAIDSVRFIGNHSSGKMGIALANEAYRLGATVELVLGPSSLSADSGISTHRITSAGEMLSTSESLFASADIAIFAAAVADYRPECPIEGKIKREKQQQMELHLVKNPDIAATLAQQKRADQLLVGFALETSCDVEEAMHKMKRKGMDLMVLNSLSDVGAGFSTDTNKVTLLHPSKPPVSLPLKSKKEVARGIMNRILEELVATC